MEILSKLNMVTMSTSGQTGAGNRPSVVTGSNIDAGASTTSSGLECQNINNCHQNSTYNNNGEEFDDWKNVHDPNKMNKLRDVVETNTSVSNKCVVDSLLQQINQLSDVEKLLLYLKLPVGKPPDLDPLKQPLNPLGSRREIQLTITWMKTHLTLDLEVSLPKDDLYKDYQNYSVINDFKALSTADFGKVMKQVYPDVRPRRLGHRGASKYCHSGLRKTFVTAPPSLPELTLDNSPNGSNYSNKKAYNSDAQLDDRDDAAVTVLYEWADKTWKIKVDNLRDLALHLIDKNLVDNRSVAAYTLVSFANQQHQRIGCGKHRETNLQLHKKIQERQDREQKRKLQEHSPSSVKSCPDRPKTRRRSGSIRNAASGDSKNVQSHSTESRFSNNQNGGTFECETNGKKLINDKKSQNDIKREGCCPPASKSQLQYSNSYMDSGTGSKDVISNNNNNNNDICYLDQKFDSKPSSPKSCLTPNMISLSSSQQQLNANKNRYKLIQPKCESNNNVIRETSPPSVTTVPSSWSDTNNLVDMTLTQDENRPIMIQEDEQPNAINFTNVNNEVDDFKMSSKFSQLREYLQQVLPTPGKGTTVGPMMGLQKVMLGPNPQKNNLEQDSCGIVNRGRRVSFQTHVDGMNNNNMCSGHLSERLQQMPMIGPIVMPNNNNNFSPINVVNQPQFVGSQGPSQTTSTNASPFVSPRDTPLHRSRHNSGQTSSTYVTPRSTSFTPDMTNYLSESSSPFMSPALTPLLSRTRHNSSLASRSRNVSGAPGLRHTPYSDDNNRRSKCSRSRNSSGNITPSALSAPLSPLIQDSTSHPVSGGDPLLYQNQFKSFQMGDYRRRHVSADTNVQYQCNLTPYTNPPMLSITNDQEVSNVMNNSGNLSTNSNQTATTNRPQSVPLPQMIAANTDMEAKSHPTTPLVHQQFHFGQEFYQFSQSSSMAPTPVPSELNDFTDYTNLDFDQVLATDTDCCRTNYGLESIDSTFTNLASTSDFNNSVIDDSSMSTPSTNTVNNDRSLMTPSYSSDHNNSSLTRVVASTSSVNNKMEDLTTQMQQHNHHQQHPANDSTNMTLNAINVFETVDSIIETPTSHLSDDFHQPFDLGDPEFLTFGS